MNWINLDERLLLQRLTLVPLSALEPNRYAYRVMLHQHRGDVQANNGGVRNADGALAHQKFTSLFQMAGGDQPDILATPEYACPWSSIEQLVDGQHWPSPGKAWVLGCESITPQELAAMQLRHPQCAWVIAGHHADPFRTFLDPLCIVLTARDSHGRDIRVVAVQFKGYEMADRKHMIEPNNMLLGTEAFIVRNNDNSVRLITLLCSDCLAPHALDTLPSYMDLPYLLFHLQLCHDPCHPDFIAYRGWWGRFDRHNFVISCLNWARGSRVLDQALPKSGSAWFARDYPASPKDTKIDDCHRGGLYYSWSQTMRGHCYLLGYDEHVLAFECVKHRQGLDDAVVRTPRQGPAPRALYRWHAATSQWQPSSPDDGLLTVCNLLHPQMEPVTDQAVSALMRERLACLTAGDIVRPSPNANWHDIQNLQTTRLGADEVCQRVTFTHDPCPHSQKARRDRLIAVKTIKHDVLRGATPLPSPYDCLRGQGDLRYPAKAGNLNLNVSLPNGDFAAAFIYIGETSLALATQKARELTIPLVNDQQSLVVWFRDAGVLQHIGPASSPSIDRDPTTTAVSFDKEV